MQISTFCRFCYQKREFDVILMYNTRLHVIVFSAFSNWKSTSCKTHHSYIIHQINIKFSFLMTKATKCWNLHVDTFNNNKYKFLAKLQHVSSLMERLTQNLSQIKHEDMLFEIKWNAWCSIRVVSWGIHSLIFEIAWFCFCVWAIFAADNTIIK